MKILVGFDGSEDGYDGLRTAAEVLRTTPGPHAFTLVIVGWPPRVSPIWDKAFEARVALDDLHRAMAEVAAREMQRLKTLFEPIGMVTPHFAEGDPVEEIVALINATKPDMFLAGVTRGRHHEVIAAAVDQILAHTGVPAFVTHGKPAT